MTEPADESQRKLVKCPNCTALVSLRKLTSHQKRVHDPKKVRRAVALENLAAVEAARDTYLATLVKCTNCHTKIQLKHIKQHFAELHASPATAEMLALVGLSEAVNMFKTSREREAYWRAAAGVELAKGEDLFDRTRVLSGGAFGLGKNGKH